MGMAKFLDERGSVAVEMTFVFPIVVVVIVVMLFFGMFMYEQVAAQAVLDDVVSRAAANWAVAGEGVYTEKSTNQGFTVFDAYSRLLDFKDGKKKQNMIAEALRRLRIICLFKDTFKDSDVSLESHNYVVYRSLTLRVDRTFHLPFREFLKNALGVSNELRYTLRGSAIVQDQPELIRTLDFAGDLMEKNSALKNVFDRLQEALQKVSQFFADLNLNQ